MKNTQNIATFFCQRQALHGKLIIDKWQRDYVWEKKHWEDFCETINECNQINNNRKYFGSIVVFCPNDVENLCDYVYVVDGQQRLTTITLSLIAIRNLLKDKNLSLFGQVSACLESNVPDNNGGYLKYLNNIEYQTQYETLLRNHCHNDLKKSSNPLYKAYDWFYKKFQQYDIDTLTLFTNNLLTKIGIFVMKCENEDEAYDVFNKQSLGKKLTSNDIIKSILLNTIRNSQLIQNEKENLTEKVNKLAQHLNKTNDDSFYSRFYYNHLNVWFIPSQILKPMERLGNNIDIINNILDFYNKESEYILPFDHLSLKVLHNDLVKYNVSPEKANYIENLLINHIVRTIITSQSATNFSLQEKIFVGLIKNLVDNNYISLPNAKLKDIINVKIQNNELYQKDGIFVIDDDEVLTKLEKFDLYNKKKHKLPQFILNKINTYYSGGINEVELITPTIEHIRPKTGIYKNEYTHTLGNLTLLCKSSNSRKQDSLKYDVYRESNLHINQHIADKLTDGVAWTDSDIINRTKELGTLLFKKILC